MGQWLAEPTQQPVAAGTTLFRKECQRRLIPLPEGVTMNKRLRWSLRPPGPGNRRATAVERHRRAQR
jgi:hypothetical protein